tara:strand:+ start:4369 stop:4656 length:288 start_codon:yes stop_codon:yes gene_type:complete
MSKGSKPRPIEIDQEEYESNWDRIFGMKDHERDVEIVEAVSEHWSSNGKKSARVIKSVKGYAVEFYVKSQMVRERNYYSGTLNDAEDAAENWCVE